MDNKSYEYGPEVSVSQLNQLMERLLNQEISEVKVNTMPICIWGKAGIGKTALVHDFAIRQDFQLVHLALAQLEEMGDLLGMPMIKDGQTVFAPPAWVPKKASKGILLIDDFNRADPRIINGIMQLLQEKKMVGWSLPTGWQIMLTANPFEAGYQVNFLDEAILTRMIHFQLTFQIADWEKWAIGKGLPTPLVDFAVSHPEIFEMGHCNPRTFAHFAAILKSWHHWEDSFHETFLLAQSLIGPQAAKIFKNYFSLQHINKLSARTLLTSTDFEGIIAPLLKKETNQGKGNAISTFFQLKEDIMKYIRKQKGELKEVEIQNLVHLLIRSDMPKDIRFQFAQELVQLRRGELDQLFRDPRIAKLIL